MHLEREIEKVLVSVIFLRENLQKGCTREDALLVLAGVEEALASIKGEFNEVG